MKKLFLTLFTISVITVSQSSFGYSLSDCTELRNISACKQLCNQGSYTACRYI